MKNKFIFTAIILSTSLFLGACGDLIKSMRAESLAIDDQLAEQDREKNPENYPYKPKLLSGASANNINSYAPPVQREYGRKLATLSDAPVIGDTSYAASSERRATRDDFIDNKPNENSLWDAQGQTNYLFTQNRKREVGDLVTADVERELKRDIQYALWMTLPPEQRKPKKNPLMDNRTPASAANEKKPGTEKSAIEKGKDAAEEAAKINMAATGEDLLRMEVVEHLGNGLVKAIGQKRVVYKGLSRVLEVTALLHGKDIDDGGKVKSTMFVDSNTQVIQ